MASSPGNFSLAGDLGSGDLGGGDLLVDPGMELAWRIWWDFMFITIISVAIVGNLIVLWIIVGKDSNL